MFAAITETSTVLSVTRIPQRVEIEKAVALDAEARHPPALRLEPLAGVEDRLVLGRDRDDVIAASAERVGAALEREVVGFGGAAGEDNLARRRADQRGHLGARVLDRLFGLPAVGVLAARRVAELLA